MGLWEERIREGQFWEWHERHKWAWGRGCDRFRSQLTPPTNGISVINKHSRNPGTLEMVRASLSSPPSHPHPGQSHVSRHPDRWPLGAPLLMESPFSFGGILLSKNSSLGHSIAKTVSLLGHAWATASGVAQVSRRSSLHGSPSSVSEQQLSLSLTSAEEEWLHGTSLELLHVGRLPNKAPTGPRPGQVPHRGNLV